MVTKVPLAMQSDRHIAGCVKRGISFKARLCSKTTRPIFTLLLFSLLALIWSKQVFGLDELDVNADNVNVHDVYLNDSFEVADAIAQANRLARAGRWTDAAMLLQRMSDNHRRLLVRQSEGRYIGVRLRLNHIIAHWPAAGLIAYRELYENELQQQLNNLKDQRDLDALLELFDRYFCTKGATSLADKIGQIAFEAGDFALAKRVYRTVIMRHPDRDQVKKFHEAMLLLIQHLEGQTSKPVPDRLARTNISWRGEIRTLGSVLGTIEPMSLGIKSSTQDWPIFAGNNRRNGNGSTQADELGLLWQFTFENGQDDANQDTRFTPTDDPDALARMLSIQPVVSGDVIILQMQREIVALYRRTGAMAWQRQSDDIDQSLADELEEQPPALYAPTVYGGRVYAALPGEVATYYGYESPATPPALICLDAASGKPIWSLTRESAGPSLDEIVFDTSPIVHEGSVYIVARRRRSFGFEDCYLLRIRAVDGTLVHKTHLGSASTGSFGSRRATLAIAAIDGDTVYVCTNLGTIAAVAARTGSVRWLRTYDRSTLAQTQHWGGQTQMISPWGYNAVIVHNKQLFVLPTDADHLFVYDAFTGELSKKITRSKLLEVQSTLGVNHGLLCVVGEKVGCYDLVAGNMRWSSELPTGALIYGRGMWVDGNLLIPTSSGISRFDISTGHRRDTDWGKNLRTGNILALPNEVYLSGPGQVSAYVLRSQLWRSLRARMAAAPNDPVPALELAEVALRNGEADEAFNAIGVAVRRAHAMLDTLDDVVRQRIYDNVMAFIGEHTDDQSIDAVKLDELFDYASDASPSGPAQVNYRLIFALRYEKLGHPQKSLRLYQQILRDRSLREETVSIPVERAKNNKLAQAQYSLSGTIATDRIDALLTQFGDSIYNQYEAEARRWLESGRAANDVTRLEMIVRTFPNSRTAPVAMAIQADLLLAEKSPERAAAILTTAYYRYPKRLDKIATIKRIADAYELAGRLPQAYSWLTKGLREYPTARFAHHGEQVSFIDYRQRLSHVRKEIEPSLPRMHWPLSPRPTMVLEENQKLLTPQVLQHPQASWSRYFISSLHEVTAFDAKKGTVQWRWPLSHEMPADLIFASKDLVLLSTTHKLHALDAATGQLRWVYGHEQDNVDAPNQDWEATNTLRTIALSNDAVVIAGDRWGLRCLDIKTGKLRWQQEKLQGPRGTMRIVEPWLVYHFAEDGGTFCRLINMTTGKHVRDLLMDDPRSLENIFLTLDGRLITVTAQSISAYDLETSERRWRYAIDGLLRRSSLLVDFDAIYFSEDGRRVRKLNLENGRTVWQSAVLSRRPQDDMRIDRQAAGVVIHTANSIAAIDEINGLTLWEGVTPENARFISRGMVSDNFIALNRTDIAPESSDSQIYCYDLRNASGLLRGKVDVGEIDKAAMMLVVDDTVLIQTDNKLLRWYSQSPTP